MRITFYCGPSHEPWSPKAIDSGIGGSEEMTINLAKELARKHEVTVYNRCLNDEGVYDGVTYVNYDDFVLKETDILIVWRSPQLYLSHHLDKVKAKKKYLWLHDTIPQLDVLPYLMAFDGIFVLSQWHKNYYTALTPPQVRDRYIVTRNATYLPAKMNGVRDPHTVVYGSMYSRGLMELLSLWPRVKTEIPDAKLRIFYGWQTLEKMMPKEEFDKLKAAIEFDMDLEGVTELGRISHAQVEQEMLAAGVWAYPCLTFNEVSCITAMRAQVCGAVPVVIARAALAETVKWGAKIETARDTGHLLEKFGDELIAMLRNTSKQEATRKTMMKKAPQEFNFHDLATAWEVLFDS